VSSGVAAMGEVGLAGELRSVSNLSRRVREAQRLGATEVIVPASGEIEELPGLVVHRCRSLAEAITIAQNGR
jgi:DNA repair protein RadA/Sms